MSNSIGILWLRNDLRLSDNPALRLALIECAQILPVFIWSPREQGDWPPGAASRVWLHGSLEQLNLSLESRGARLVLRMGDSLEELESLVAETGASAVYWNRRYDPYGVVYDARIEAALGRNAVRVRTFNGSLLHDPQQIKTSEGRPFRMFTPFWNSLSSQLEPAVLSPAPRMIPFVQQDVYSAPLGSLQLLPNIDWAGGIRDEWMPGEQGAHARLEKFITDAITGYATGRDRPDEAGVSMLSPHLHFGEISPWQIVHAARSVSIETPEDKHGIDVYLKELGWREFAHHILFHYPATIRRPLSGKFENFPWDRFDKNVFARWCQGQTGYPIVDAGMRQLWHTGWMHNRVRMIVGSFLTKHLLVHWMHGARWFWDTLVDADLANNTLGWQWVSGCGADAAPYFRIFNPQLQGEKFDSSGNYVRRWVPELSGLPAAYIHKPWKAPGAVLASAGVELGKTYPAPMIDHQWARTRALDAFSQIGKTVSAVKP